MKEVEEGGEEGGEVGEVKSRLRLSYFSHCYLLPKPVKETKHIHLYPDFVESFANIRKAVLIKSHS